MTKNNTVEKIDQIINKINENLPKESLSKGEIEKLLNSIDDGLIKVEESAEKNQKEIVNKKVEELRNTIDSSRRWMWGRISGALENNVRNELVELIAELEKSVVPYKPEDNMVGREIVSIELEKEVAKWRLLFRNKTPEEAYEELRGAAKFMEKQQAELVKLQEMADKVAKDSNSPAFLEVASNIRSAGESYVELGSKIGKDSGLGIFLEPAGGLVGLGVGFYQGSLEAGAYFANRGLNLANKTREGMKEYALETQKDLKDHIEHHADNAEKLTEKVLDNTKDVIREGMSSTREVAKDFIGIFNRKKITQSLEEKNKTLEQQLEKKDEEFKQRLEEMSERIERKNEEIEDLRERKDNEIRRLQANNDKLQEQLIAQIAQVEKKPYSRQ